MPSTSDVTLPNSLTDSPSPNCLAASIAESQKTKVAILQNPRAGWRGGLDVVQEFCQSLQARGLEPNLCQKLSEFGDLLSAHRKEWRCIVAAGGDGTLLEVVNRARGVPVTVLPLGNENLVARHFGLPKSGVGLAKIIATGRLWPMDLGSAGGRLFSVMIGVGIEADVVHRVHRRRRGHINKLHYALAIAQSLAHYGYPRFDVEIADTGERFSGAMALVFNLPQYALNLPIARDACSNNGKLEIFVFGQGGLWHLARYTWSTLWSKQTALPDCHHRLARRINITASQPTPVQVDGDPAGWLPVQIEVLPGAVTLVVP